MILFVVDIFLFDDLFDRLDSYAELVDRLRSEVAHERSEREAWETYGNMLLQCGVMVDFCIKQTQNNT